MKENYVEYIERSIRDNWYRDAFTDYQGSTMTYGDVAARICRLHEFFREAGLAGGDKVSVLGRNSASWAVTYLAVTTYGAVIVPILPDFHPADAENIVNHSDSRFLFASPAFIEKLNPANMPNLEATISLADFTVAHERPGAGTAETLLRANETFDGECAEYLSPETFALERVPGSELESIVYTSGTTGFSKGVMLSHGNIISNLVYAQANVHLEAGDTIVSFLPLAHCFGNAFDFVFPFSRGCHVTFLCKAPTPKMLIEAFALVKPRMVLSVPLIIEKIYWKQVKPTLGTPKMKFLMKVPVVKSIVKGAIRKKMLAFFGGNVLEVIIGGASFNPEVEDFLNSIRFPFTVGYGMTECAPLIGYADWSYRTKASSGRLVDRMEMKIVGATDDAPGEFCVRGENVTKGYYKNPEETARVIDEEGWFHTGDLGYRDEEGFIHIRGRSKTMILGASGQNIYPEEIEAKLNALPLVAESLVIEDEGALTALVYPDLTEAKNRGFGIDSLSTAMETNRIELNRMLPEYGRIKRIDLQNDEFQKTPTNKIKRFLYAPKNPKKESASV
jgi:long-chain acyl-CoA synthetase